jgi:metal-dependent amidase/aminoacylase/carboxypeptidase family protein
LLNIVSRNCKPTDTAVISATMVHAGEATNVVPDRCEIQGTVRAFRTEVLDLIERRMEQIARHTCTAAEAGCEFAFHRRVPAVVNHQREAEFASPVTAGIVGPQNARVQEPAMASEDFAFMLQAKAGAYYFIGNGDGAHRELGHGGGPCMLHNPSYDVNDELIPLGATYWVCLAEGWLGQAPR